PLIDAQLTAMDARMHFATITVVHLAAHWRAVKAVFVIAYALEPLLLLTALVFLPFMGHAEASRRYVLGIVVAAVITAGAFALWPAAGPWMTEGYRPTHSQTLATGYLQLLKTPKPVALDMQDAGIVAFPSFHTLLALLSAIALSSMRRLRVAAWVIAALIIISTLTTGWHYLTDVLGGIVLTAISVAVVRVVLPARVEAAAREAAAASVVCADAEAAGVPVAAGHEDGAAGGI
ncbi:MAG TPA: phosphatase PAP2 family protein, partial [Acidobacteriaceae bacterium]